MSSPSFPLPSAPLAIGVLSGGLDSLLAARMVREQGLRVIGYHFISPFFGWDHAGREEELAVNLGRQFGFEVRVRSLWPGYLDIVRTPVHGWGKHLNPCLDCKILMLSRARRSLEREGGAFVFTGEVLGQRPMSQRLHTLRLIECESGLEGRLVRPLSARHLPPTLPEREGVLDRERLLGFSGRTRKPQMELATRLGIAGYPAPAGGCLLTEKVFSSRLHALLSDDPAPSLAAVELLSVGRHFRLGARVRLVVGRDQEENRRIAERACGLGLLLQPEGDVAGPTAILLGPGGDTETALAARIVARYSDPKGVAIPVVVERDGERVATMPADPLPHDLVEPLRI